MMEWIGYMVIGVWLVLFTVSLSNWLSRPWLRPAASVSDALVSVLIPARNEEKNLPVLLDALLRTHNQRIEIIVCDDHSTDQTAAILQEFALHDSRIRWFSGLELPKGWTGKNFACQQLATHARGDYLLFLDADVVPAPTLIGSSVAAMISLKLSLLSLFPRQITRTAGEKITVPIVDWILLSLLPLRLVQSLKHPSISAANGQCMMFPAAEYRLHQWHQQVHNKPVDDILIARLVKDARLKMAVFTGRDQIGCRMYSDYNEAITGFSRNVHEYFGGHTWLALFFWVVAGAGPLMVAFFLSWPMALLLLILILLNRMLVNVAGKQPVVTNLWLHPIQMAAFGHMILRRIHSLGRNTTEWKGREVRL